MAKRSKDRYGQSHVNNKWRQVIDVNLTGVFLGSRAYAEWHIANGKKEGVIISVSSISKNGDQGQTNYSAVLGLVAMTALWAGELVDMGSCRCDCADSTDTDLKCHQRCLSIR